VPWAHMDIAGPAWVEESKPYTVRGATGFGARLMASYVLNHANR
jgi:leucyl aminopeptidase